jgi:hypothetical protein
MNSRFEKLSEMIEGAEFRFHVNMASGFKMFERLVEQQAVFSDLVEFATTGEGAEEIEAHIEVLMSDEADPQYENPHDAGIAAYLLALDRAGYRVNTVLAENIGSTQNFWWGRKVAARILARSVNIQMWLQHVAESPADELTTRSEWDETLSHLAQAAISFQFAATEEASERILLAIKNVAGLVESDSKSSASVSIDSEVGAKESGVRLLEYHSSDSAFAEITLPGGSFREAS